MAIGTTKMAIPDASVNVLPSSSIQAPILGTKYPHVYFRRWQWEIYIYMLLCVLYGLYPEGLIVAHICTCGNLPQSARSQVEDWLPTNLSQWRNHGGLVNWLPSRVTQQWRTSYLATKQSDATMEAWLPAYQAEWRNNGGLVTYQPITVTQQWRTG
jgi:hypothetical protein